MQGMHFSDWRNNGKEVVELNKNDRTELTLKQRRFAAEYCVDLHDTAAHIWAGYSARATD